MQPTAYIFFRTNCRDAMTFYGEVFGTAPEIMSVGDMPEDVRAAMPPVADDAVMHAAVPIGTGWLYGSDDLFGEFGEGAGMAGCNVAISMPDDAETRRVYEALSAGGEIRSPLEPVFWTSLYSAFTDRFGVRWMVMTESPAP